MRFGFLTPVATGPKARAGKPQVVAGSTGKCSKVKDGVLCDHPCFHDFWESGVPGLARDNCSEASPRVVTLAALGELVSQKETVS